MAYFFPSTPHAGNSAELYAPQNLCVRFPAQGRNLYPAPPSNPQPVSAASPDSPSKAARKNCLCCMGRHRAHTCGLGGRRGRPKGSTCNKRQHSNAGTSSAGAKARTSTPPSALLQRQLHSRRLLEMQQRLSAHSNLLPLQSRVMLPAGTTAISEGAPGPTPGVKCQTTASFAAELLAHYDSVRTALSTDAESSSSSSGSSPHGPPFSGAPFESHTVQQHRPQLFTHEEAAPPYLMRFAMTLFYVDTILRMGTGICATLEFGPPSSLAQPPTLKVSYAEAERNLRELVRAHIHGAPGLTLLQSVRETLSVGSLILVPDAAPETSSSSSPSSSSSSSHDNSSSSSSSSGSSTNSSSSSSSGTAPVTSSSSYSSVSSASASAASFHEQRMEALRGAVWQPCATCAPFACQRRGASGHAAAPTAVAVHLRVLHHFRSLTHEALLRSTVPSVARSSKWTHALQHQQQHQQQQQHYQQQQQLDQQQQPPRQSTVSLPLFPPPRLLPPPSLPAHISQRQPQRQYSSSYEGAAQLGRSQRPHLKPPAKSSLPAAAAAVAEQNASQQPSATASASSSSSSMALAPRPLLAQTPNQEAATAAMTAAVAAMVGLDSGLAWNNSPSTSTLETSAGPLVLSSSFSSSSSSSSSSSLSEPSFSSSISSHVPNSSSSFASISSDALSRSELSNYYAIADEEIHNRLQAVKNACAAYSIASSSLDVVSPGEGESWTACSGGLSDDEVEIRRERPKKKAKNSAAAAASPDAALQAPEKDNQQFDGEKHRKKSGTSPNRTTVEEAECAQVLSCLRGLPK